MLNENDRSSTKLAEDVVLCASENFSGTEAAFQAESVNRSDIWCLDSGSTSHLCRKLEKFVEITDSKPGKLDLATNASSEIIARGKVSFTADVLGEKKSVTLQNTLHVPDLRSNLLSVAKITDQNCEVIFKNNCAMVIGEDGRTKLLANRIGDLYLVREEKQHSCCVTSGDAKNVSSSSAELEKWHRRLGHLNVKDLLTCEREGTVQGLNLGIYKEGLKC